jgi:lactoylglutathione lyase
MHVAHVAAWTRDLEGACAFFRRYFGATSSAPYHSRRRLGFVSRILAFPGGQTGIELMSAPWIADPPSSERIGWDHIAISLGSVAAVDELAARCQADGLLVSPPRKTGDGFYEAVVAMPDGTRVEITA